MMWNWLAIDRDHDLVLVFRNHHRMIELDHSLRYEVLRGIDAAEQDYNSTMLVWQLLGAQLIRDLHNRI